MRERPDVFHGWYVVGCAFVVAVCGFGFGFYGPGLYLASIHLAHGWPVGLVSAAVALHFFLGAVWTIFIGDAIDRLGPRSVVLGGALALAAGVGSLALVHARWQLFVAFAVTSLGWAAMNGAAVSAIVAPWFDRKRGLAISLALNGGSCGGILVPPLLVFLTARHGFGAGLGLALAAMLAVLVPLAIVGLARRPEDVADAPDGSASGGAVVLHAKVAPAWRRREALRDRAFLTICAPFVLAFLAQVGFLTHQITYLVPIIGMRGAALAVSLTTIAALAGRTLVGTFIDHVDRRAVSCGIFLLQAVALAILLAAESRTTIYAGCMLFGVGVGNTNTLPPLIVQREFPREHFSRVVSLVVATNQFAFALGPPILGTLRDISGEYRLPFTLCIALELIAAAIVLTGRREQR
jgi:MFS family permease